MANKKQIKELVIQTTSKGTKEVVNEVVSLNEALKGAVTASDALTGSLKGGAKYVGQIALAYSNATKSINGSLDAVKKLNTALNGDTKKASQSMSAYLDNLQLLNLELNTTSVAANKAANALGRMASATQMDTLIANIEDIAHEMEMLRTTSEKSIEVLKKGFYDLGQSIERTEDVAIDTTRAIGKLGEQVGKTGEKTEKTKKQTDLLNNSIRRLTASGSSSARAFSSLAFGMNPLVSAYAAIAVNIYAVTEAFRLLKEASGLQRLEEQTAGFASAMSGLNVKDIARDIQEASKGALDFGEALKTAVRGVSFDFTRDQLLELTEGARKASIALGRDFSDSMDRVIRGISKAEVELLDELGVVTRLETAFANYVAKAGIAGLTVNKLTDAQRRLALTQEVNTQLQKRYGKSIEVVTTGWEALGVATKDFSNVVLKGLAKSLEGSATGLAKFFASLGPVSSAATNAAESQATFNKALTDGNYSQALAALSEYNRFLLEFDETADKTSKALAEQAATIDSVSTAVGALVSFLVASKALSIIMGISSGLFSLIGTAERLAKTLATLRVVIAALMGPLGITVALLAAAAGVATAYTFEAISTATSDAAKQMTGYNKTLKEHNQLQNEAVDKVSQARSRFRELAESLKALSNAGVKLPADLQNIAKLTAPQIDRKVKGADPKGIQVMLQRATESAQEFSAEMQTFEKSVPDTMSNITKNLNNLGRASTPLDDIADKFDGLILSSDKFYGNTQLLAKTLGGDWERLQSMGIVAKDLDLTQENARKVADRFLTIRDGLRAINESNTLEVLQESLTGKDDAQLSILKAQKEQLVEQYSLYRAIGGAVGEYAAKEVALSITLTNEKIRQAEIDRKLLDNSRQRELISAQLAANAEINATAESTVLEQTKAVLLAEKAVVKESGRGTEELDHKLKLLDIEIAKKKQLEALEYRLTGLSIALRNQEAITAKAGTEATRVASLEKELALKKSMIETNTQLSGAQKAEQLSGLALEQASLAGMKDGAAFKDASSVLGNISGLEGLTDLQSTFAGSMSGISDTYSKFLTDMEGKGGSFMDYLTGNIDGMSNVLSSSLSLAQAAFSQISDAKIASIDAEIEAEKRRDGKSEESLAKIKKLQAQKIKEETKAKKASVIMSTATAVMQAFAQMGPFGAPFAAALGAIGMLQLATIDKAASGQLAGLSSGSANLSISGGNRSNEIDVSRRANAGELSYLQGANGSGSASNFMPGKAVGGYSSAGTSIVVGESGPEVITPAVPVNVTPSGQAGNPIQITLSPVFNTSTIDSSGFEQLTQRFSRELYDGLERELRARNRTLDNL